MACLGTDWFDEKAYGDPEQVSNDWIAAKGSDIENNYNSDQCMQCAKSLGTATDPRLRAIAAFALHTGFAKQERLAGRIMSAIRAESNAQTSYLALPENCRW